jgi:hypothetical protein
MLHSLKDIKKTNSKKYGGIGETLLRQNFSLRDTCLHVVRRESKLRLAVYWNNRRSSTSIVYTTPTWQLERLQKPKISLRGALKSFMVLGLFYTVREQHTTSQHTLFGSYKIDYLTDSMRCALGSS